jgi:hypothetical protein
MVTVKMRAAKIIHFVIPIPPLGFVVLNIQPLCETRVEQICTLDPVAFIAVCSGQAWRQGKRLPQVRYWPK